MFQVYVVVNGEWQAEGKPFASYGMACRWAESFDPRGFRAIVRRVRA